MGKPLIFHTIDCCKKLKFLTPFVSTDSKKILNYSKKCGIKFDYVRPKKISKDKSQITDAVFHALKWFESKNIFFDSVMMLQPTSPVRDKEEVKRIYRKFMREKLSCIVTVSKSREHPYKFFKIEQKVIVLENIGSLRVLCFSKSSKLMEFVEFEHSENVANSSSISSIPL